MARYSLFVLKVPLNTKQASKQANKQTQVKSKSVGRRKKCLLFN